MIFTYNAKVEKNTADLVVQSQIFSGTKLVYSTQPAKINIPESADLERIPFAARLSLAGYNPGAYELKLVVTDRLAKATSSRSLNFTVE